MTPDQFKAWFEGFCEAVIEAPTPEQWAKIKAKVADMGGPVLRIDRPDMAGQRFLASRIAQNGHNADPISPDRSFASGVIPVSHETRVVDAVSGADLGPSD